MINLLPKLRLRPTGLAAIGAGLVASTLLAAPAQARVYFGFGFPLFGPPAYYPPPPVYYPPPAYYPPPGYYPPPAAYAPPTAYSPMQAQPGGQSCHADAYVCPMDRPVSPGSGCYCTVNGNRVWGRAS